MITKEDLKPLYYKGENECPKEFLGSAKMCFWTMEKYVLTHFDEMLDSGAIEKYYQQEKNDDFERETNGDWSNKLYFLSKEFIGKYPDITEGHKIMAYLCCLADDFSDGSTYLNYFEPLGK